MLVAARVAEKKQHSILGQEVEVELLLTPTSKSFVSQSSDTILVKGLKDCHTEVALSLFFTNKKKCGGGEVTKIIIREGSAYVTFADPESKQLCVRPVAI